MKKLFSVALGMVCLVANGQEPSKNYLRLYSDSTIYVDRVKLRDDPFGRSFYTAEGRIRADDVAFFSDRNGVFANTSKLFELNGSEFVEQVVAGKINAYSDAPYIHPRTSYRRRWENNSVGFLRYYNKGFEPLARINYDNLSMAMQDNPTSMNLLEGYRQKQKTANIMYGLGIGATVASFTTFLIKGLADVNKKEDFSPGWFDRPGPNFALSFVLLGAGAGLGIGGFLQHRKAQLQLERAIKSYNH